MNRRQSIALIGSAAAWPFAAGAQEPDRMRRIGILMSVTRDPVTEGRITAFQQALQKLGWTNSDNVQIDVRWGNGDLDRIRKYASELAALFPDVIVANGAVPVQALMHATRDVPIVFVLIVDPVGQGFVQSLARPGGNITGFSLFEFSICGKWVELLNQVSPRLKRIGVLRDPTDAAGSAGQYAIVQATAQSYGIEAIPIDTTDAAKIERGIGALGGAPGHGIVVTTSQSATVYCKLITTLAVRYRLPAVYPLRYYAIGGGLISYGPDLIDQIKRAAGYADRILKGEKPADLPVQAPTKYELVINLKTAKSLGLAVPQTLLATADEVIE